MATKKKTDGFDEGSADSPEEDAANKRAVERMQRATAGEDEPGPQDDDEDLEIPGDEPEDEPAARPSRSERRAERGRMRDENAELRDRSDRLEREVAEMRGRLSAIPTTPATPVTAPDPLDAEAKQLRQAWDGYAAKRSMAVQAQATPQQIAEIDEEGWSIRDKMGVNHARRAMKESGVQPGAGPAQVQQQVLKQRLEGDFPDVMGDPGRVRVFMGNMQRLVGMGHRDDYETVRAAMETTRKDLRLQPNGGKRLATTEATRRKYTGGSRGGSAPADGKDTIRVSPENRKMIEKMADVAYRHLPKDRRVAAYLKHNGEKIRNHVERK